MPAIYRYLGILFYFYSNEHEPIHVHARKQKQEIIFDLYFENGKLKELKTRKNKKNKPLSPTDMSKAENFIKKHAKQIAEKWNTVFVLNGEVKCETITKKKAK